MRSALAALVVLVPALAAAEPPLLSLEARLAGGVAMDAAPTQTWRVAPFSVGVGAEGAVRTYPTMSLYGLATVEGNDFYFGASGGVRFRTSDGGPLRMGLGVAALLAPSTMLGVQGAIGGCTRPAQLHVCAELEGTAYVAGDLLPEGQIVTQLRLALELGFDVF